MVVSDPIDYIFAGLELGVEGLKINILTWFLLGGWKFVLRTFGFWIDTNLVKIIGKIYTYFMQLLEGKMFTDEVISELMRNVYVFIGIIMFFRLMMIVIKYVVNPDLVNDAKLGVNSLIKRVVIGMCGILFFPTIFDVAMEFQSNVVKDQLIQQIVIPKSMLDAVMKKVDRGGEYIGTYVLAGFISPGENASNQTKKEYKQAVENGDLSSINTLDKDGWLDNTYEYDYFFLISTLCLGYVLYLMIKYCLDVATRFFRLLMYQMLAPIAMIEYMINGSDDGVFKSWRTGVLGTYFMLFIRMIAIWFVVFVMVLMSDKTSHSAGTLLATDDFLLKALIIIALLGFLMDLPKLIGQVFGLDLEQESGAGGILKQVGGMLKTAAIGGLSMGGAAIGGAIGAGKALGKTGMGMKGKDGTSLRDKLNNKLSSNGTIQSLNNRLGNNSFMQSAKENNLKEHMQKAGSGIFAAAMGSNQYTGSAYKGYRGQADEQDGIDKSAKAKELESNRHKEILDNQKEIAANQKDIIDNQRLAAALEVVAILDQSGIKVDPQNLVARMYPEMMSNSNASIETSAKVGGIIGAAAAQLSVNDVDSNGNITNASAKEKVVQEVEQVLTSQCVSSGINVDQNIIHQQAEMIVDTSNFSVSGGKVTATVIADVAGEVQSLAEQDQVITQTINQVAGIRMNGAVEDATQIINQTLGQVVDNTSATSAGISQTIDIQRNISDNVSRSVEIQEDIQYDVHAQTDIQRNQVSMVDDIRENTIPTRSDREIPRGDN